MHTSYLNESQCSTDKNCLNYTTLYMVIILSPVWTGINRGREKGKFKKKENRGGRIKNVYCGVVGLGKTYTGRGSTSHILLMGGTIGVGTPHNIERMTENLKMDFKLLRWVCGPLWVHLASWNLPDFQL